LSILLVSAIIGSIGKIWLAVNLEVNAMSTGAELGFYSDAELDQLTSLSRTTRWREIKAGRFPKPVELSPGRKGFAKRAIHQWMAARDAQATAEETTGTGHAA
jgi:prophage regulatory protein